MRIALTHPYSWPEVRRGAERIVAETSCALASRGHDVTVLTAGNDAGRFSERGVRTIKVRRIFRDPVRHERWFGWRVVPELLIGRYEVVHSFFPSDAVASIRVRRFTRNLTVYDDMGIAHRWWLEQVPDRNARLRVIADVDVYGCMSRHALGALERDWGRAGTLIPGGVRLSEFAPASMREPRPTILYSGQLDDPRKGVAALLEAFSIVRASEPSARLWLSGQGDPVELLRAASPAARDGTEVLPLGEARGQADRYGRAWVTALPSIGDSFGLVLLESLACGSPIVTTSDSAPPELVTPETGAVCEPNDPESLAAALRAALELARRPETVTACREFARRFDWDEGIAPLLENIYDTAVATV
jgi:phosphatidylinositol alpha-mannosyltransferase